MLIHIILKHIDSGIQEELKQNEIEKLLKDELMISGKVTPVNSDEKSPEEAFREQIDVTGDLPYENQRNFATRAGNNSPTEKSRGENDDGSQPSLEEILID